MYSGVSLNYNIFESMYSFQEFCKNSSFLTYLKQDRYLFTTDKERFALA